MRSIVAMIVLVAFLAAGGNDNGFLDALDSHNVTYLSPDAAIAAGHLICSKISGGETPLQVAQDVIASSNLDAYHAGFVTGAAIGAYCPQYGGSLG